MSTYLITSGGTKVAIDEVRHVGNMSSGRFGSKLAEAALCAGHKVKFLCAKGSVRPDEVKINIRTEEGIRQMGEALANREYADICNSNLDVYEYKDFDEYASLLENLCTHEDIDVTILNAAVSDYGMPKTGGKISSDKDEITFTMTKLPKLISKVKEWNPDTFLVGFKLLVDMTMESRAEAVRKQIESSHVDLVVVNDLRQIKNSNHILYVHSHPGSVTVLKGYDIQSKLVSLVDSEIDR